MNITEAQSINVLLDALYGSGVETNRLNAAAKALAGKAYLALGAGWSVQTLCIAIDTEETKQGEPKCEPICTHQH
jgi:hypothetical protein